MKKLIGIFAASLILTACGKEKVVYETSNPASNTPSVNVSINTTANGGAISNSGNSSNDNTASGGSSSSTAQGGSASNSNSSTNNNSQSQSNNQTTNVSQSSVIDVQNELELMAGILGGRVYEADSDDKANPKCKAKEELKTGKNGKQFCVKPPKSEKAKEGLACKLYDLNATKPSKLPDFGTMTAVYSFTADQLDVGDQSYAGGFPKINDASVRSKYLEWYGVRCVGNLKVAKADSYTFYLTADDGAILTLDGSKIIDNDGLHSPQTKGTLAFISKGSHAIQIDYYQGPRTQIALLLEWSSAAMAKVLVDKALFTH